MLRLQYSILQIYIMTYFKFSEFVNSKISDSLNLDNTPLSPYVLGNLASLWYTLDLIRKELGFPIIINSAYRCVKLNQVVGGVKNSLHLKGRAADIRTNYEKMQKLRDILQRYYNNGDLSEFKDYTTYFHVAL